MDSNKTDRKNEFFTEVYVWGNDASGQLGLGHKHVGKDYQIPKVCSYNLVIRQISCGEEHTAFVTFKGHIYTVGSNLRGKLGIDNQEIMQSSSPCLVENLQYLVCSSISCGANHTVAVMQNGEAYSWGYGDYGMLGNGTISSVWNPIKMIGCDQKKLVKVSCGRRHTMLLNEKGEVLACGSNEEGQLGIPKSRSELIPNKVSNQRMTEIASGDSFTLFLTMFGEVLSCGQIGMNSREMKKVGGLEGEIIIQLAAGGHAAALTKQGEIYLWGNGVFGEQISPYKFSKIDSAFSEISIGGQFGSGVDVNGVVWTWGQNEHGELGVGDFEERTIPFPVAALKERKVSKIACGYNFMISLSIPKNVSDIKVKSNQMRQQQLPILKRKCSQTTIGSPVDESNSQALSEFRSLSGNRYPMKSQQVVNNLSFHEKRKNSFDCERQSIPMRNDHNRDSYEELTIVLKEKIDACEKFQNSVNELTQKCMKLERGKNEIECMMKEVIEERDKYEQELQRLLEREQIRSQLERDQQSWIIERQQLQQKIAQLERDQKQWIIEKQQLLLKIDAMNYEYEKTITEKQQIELEMEKLNHQNSIEIEEELIKISKQLDKLTLDNSQISSSNEDLQAINLELKQQNSEFKYQFTELKQQTSEFKLQNSELKKEVSEIKQQNNDIKKFNCEISKESSEIKLENNELKKWKIKYNDEIRQLKDELRIFTNKENESKREIENLTSQVTYLKEESNNLRNELTKEAAKKVDELKAKMRQAERQEEIWKQEVDELKKQLMQEKCELHRLQTENARELHSYQLRIATLEGERIDEKGTRRIMEEEFRQQLEKERNEMQVRVQFTEERVKTEMEAIEQQLMAQIDQKNQIVQKQESELRQIRILSSELESVNKQVDELKKLLKNKTNWSEEIMKKNEKLKEEILLLEEKNIKLGQLVNAQVEKQAEQYKRKTLQNLKENSNYSNYPNNLNQMGGSFSTDKHSLINSTISGLSRNNKQGKSENHSHKTSAIMRLDLLDNNSNNKGLDELPTAKSLHQHEEITFQDYNQSGEDHLLNGNQYQQLNHSQLILEQESKDQINQLQDVKKRLAFMRQHQELNAKITQFDNKLARIQNDSN